MKRILFFSLIAMYGASCAAEQDWWQKFKNIFKRPTTLKEQLQAPSGRPLTIEIGDRCSSSTTTCKCLQTESGDCHCIRPTFWEGTPCTQ